MQSKNVFANTATGNGVEKAVFGWGIFIAKFVLMEA